MELEMQAPILVFDHIKHIVATIPTGPAADKRLAELLASQREQISTSGRPSG
jgi:hypothetical protein